MGMILETKTLQFGVKNWAIDLIFFFYTGRRLVAE